MTAAVGFTGTRHGMTRQQSARVKRLLVSLVRSDGEFHYGCSGRSDRDAALAARQLGYRLVGHPARGLPAWRTRIANDEERPELAPMARNRAIVAESRVLVAAPHGSGENVRRSGTWGTIRAARTAGLPHWVVWPDGSVDFFIGEELQ